MGKEGVAAASLIAVLNAGHCLSRKAVISRDPSSGTTAHARDHLSGLRGDRIDNKCRLASYNPLGNDKYRVRSWREQVRRSAV